MLRKFSTTALISSSTRLCHSKSTKTAVEMASELRDKIQSGSVQFFTANKVVRIDLAGRAHFEKTVQEYIPTPHVHTSIRHDGELGLKYFFKNQPVIAATKDDIRLARKLSK